jgi:hypothetical protein
VCAVFITALSNCCVGVYSNLFECRTITHQTFIIDHKLSFFINNLGTSFTCCETRIIYSMPICIFFYHNIILDGINVNQP